MQRAGEPAHLRDETRTGGPIREYAMGEASTTLHEAAGALSPETVEQHRALVSLQEELEAVDWYRQRADAAADEGLREILLHNMREEIEHACMVLEWLRRRNPLFDQQLRTYLFTEGPVTEVEEHETGDGPGGAGPEQPRLGPTSAQGLTVGSLKKEAK
jgi:ferritin-like protein